MLVLFGNDQRLEIHPWQAADEMTVSMPFEWALNAWYRMKMRVENRNDGTTLVQGKVWPAGQPEPTAWTIQKEDKIPHRKGSPGLYADGYPTCSSTTLRVYQESVAGACHKKS